MFARFFLSAASFALTGAAGAQEPRPALDHETVLTVMTQCLEWAEERDLSLSIAVVDAAGEMRGFVTMDGALLATRDIARRKAYTSAAVNAPTEDASWLAQLPGVLEGGDYVPLRGGVPIRAEDGALIGGMGVSGAPSEVDQQCAVAAVEAAGLQHGVTPPEDEDEG